MWCDTRMKLILLVLFLICFIGAQSKRVKKVQNEIVTLSKDHEVLKNHNKNKIPRENSAATSAPAIIAIEIVDANDNSTKSKNSKRTVDSSLGYGYQENYFGARKAPPKYEVYKYSQRNIPSYPGSSYTENGRPRSQFSIQKAITYDLGSTIQQQLTYNKPTRYTNVANQPSLNQYYQPGTVLYSTLNQQGHLGRLTSQAPHVQGAVPVILVRIYTNQLSNSGALYPNLPRSHPYSNLNSIDLQSLLSNYLTKVLNQQDYSKYNQQNLQQTTQSGAPSYQQIYQNYKLPHQEQYQGYQYQQLRQQYQQPQQVLQQHYEEANDADNLPTHENYPDDAHTRVIFHSHSKSRNPEKTENYVPAVLPSNLPYKSTPQTYVPTPESYSSLELNSPNQQYTYNGHVQKQTSPVTRYVYDDTHLQNQNSQVTQYVYNTPTQDEDESGYYYQKPSQQEYIPQHTGNIHNAQIYQPTDTQDYPEQSQVNTKIIQSTESSALFDTQTVTGQPYNYHALRSSKSRKRNIRRPIVVEEIRNVKEEDSE